VSAPERAIFTPRQHAEAQRFYNELRGRLIERENGRS
jgi:hypothetical protein